MLKTATKQNFDFWKFYNDNKEILDGYIWKICWKYQKAFTPEDMYSEILIRLHKSKFHEQYDPTKGTTFYSYIYMKMNSYARHIIEYKNRRLKIDCMSEAQKVHIEDAHENNFISKYSLDYSVEDKITYDELCELILKEIPQEKAKIMFKLYYKDGEKLKDIAEALGCSAAFVTQLKSKIQQYIINLNIKEQLQ